MKKKNLILFSAFLCSILIFSFKGNENIETVQSPLREDVRKLSRQRSRVRVPFAPLSLVFLSFLIVFADYSERKRSSYLWISRQESGHHIFRIFNLKQVHRECITVYSVIHFFMSIQTLLAQFIEYSKYIKNYSPTTIAQYKHLLGYYCKYSNISNIEEVTQENVMNFILSRTC